MPKAITQRPHGLRYRFSEAMPEGLYPSYWCDMPEIVQILKGLKLLNPVCYAALTTPYQCIILAVPRHYI
ncbi:MAG: hypothetical protein ACFE0J_21595 [Elainellaceae cyanobacterium]